MPAISGVVGGCSLLISALFHFLTITLFSGYEIWVQKFPFELWSGNNGAFGIFDGPEAGYYRKFSPIFFVILQPVSLSFQR